jgi:plastocyanin
MPTDDSRVDGEASQDESAVPGTETLTGEDDADAVVRMVTEGGDHYFDPVGLAVEPGARVAFQNTGGTHSTVAFTEDHPASRARRIPDGAEGWNSGALAHGDERFEVTLGVEGTYDYFCDQHTEGMLGRIVVGEPGGPAAETPPPDATLPDGRRIVERGRVEYDEFEG